MHIEAAKPARLLVFLTLAALLAGIVSLLVGPAAIGTNQLVAALLGDDRGAAALIVQQVRLPRTVLALSIGATLGLSGAVLQGLLRNPLAEPGVIGVSAAAALGAVITIVLGLTETIPWALPTGGMAGACVAAFLVQALAGRYAGTLTVVLSGVAITSLAGALTALALNFAPNPFAALEVVFWMLGSLADRSWQHVWLALPFMIVGWILLGGLARPLDALTLGEDAAQSLGVNLDSVRRKAVIGAALSVGAATSVAGGIGFVGLVAPHLVRPLVGGRPGALLPAAALGGAVLTASADICVRLLSSGRELKLGVVTALVGAPFFLYLVLKTRRGLE